MFSGKSEELMRRLTRAEIAGQRIEILRPPRDTRHASDELITHSGRRMRARRIESLDQISRLDAAVLGLDEIQFFDPGIVEVIDERVSQGVRVICCGLDMDYRRQAWPVVATLLARAEFIDKLQSVCLGCGGPATISHRIDPSQAQQVQIGAQETYRALCRRCSDDEAAVNARPLAPT